MDALERYLDQVCRSIGGPRSLRRHVRQELHEHLLDAAAQHQQDGMSAEDALERAIAEFGSPQDMRTELAAAHGQRMLSVVIDKAMQWKEKTMRAKWVWTTWATAAIVVTLALEVLFITFTDLFIVPKFNKLLQDGLIDPAIIEEQGVSWLVAWLVGFNRAAEYTTLWVLLTAAAWGLFEWRVRSENKTLMRLSALGTVAAGLMCVVWLMSATLLISFCLGAPANGRLARQFAVDQIARITASVDEMAKSAAKDDWKAAEKQATQAAGFLTSLTDEAAAIPALKVRNEPATVDELRGAVSAARDALSTAARAIDQKDAAKLATATELYRKSFTRLSEAATRAENVPTKSGQ